MNVCSFTSHKKNHRLHYSGILDIISDIARLFLNIFLNEHFKFWKYALLLNFLWTQSSLKVTKDHLYANDHLTLLRLLNSVIMDSFRPCLLCLFLLKFFTFWSLNTRKISKSNHFWTAMFFFNLFDFINYKHFLFTLSPPPFFYYWNREKLPKY
jgi:hypothetical protein